MTAPRPSQRGHMPPVTLNSRRSFTVRPARSVVTAPAPLIEATLKENAWGEPMCGCPRRLNTMRNIAFVSVTVPTVERGLAPIRSWSTMIAVVSPSRTSTSGRASVGMKPCTNALYVSLIIRCDSAAIVENTSELLPEPETPVNTVSLRLGDRDADVLEVVLAGALHADQVMAVGDVLVRAHRVPPGSGHRTIRIGGTWLDRQRRAVCLVLRRATPRPGVVPGGGVARSASAHLEDADQVARRVAQRAVADTPHGWSVAPGRCRRRRSATARRWRRRPWWRG